MDADAIRLDEDKTLVLAPHGRLSEDLGPEVVAKLNQPPVVNELDEDPAFHMDLDTARRLRDYLDAFLDEHAEDPDDE